MMPSEKDSYKWWIGPKKNFEHYKEICKRKHISQLNDNISNDSIAGIWTQFSIIMCFAGFSILWIL